LLTTGQHRWIQAKTLHLMSDQAEPASAEPGLHIPRILELKRSEDQTALLAAAEHRPELRALVETTLDDYLRWFTAPEWQRIYSGGLVSSPSTTGGVGRSGFGIQRLLETTARLQELRRYDGFDRLLSGLRNPTQISATMFEIAAAAWCAQRETHQGLVFSPAISKASGVKRPDFLWETSLGDLTCECKEAGQWEQQESRTIGHLREIAVAALTEAGGLPDDLRLDITVDGPLSAAYERQLSTLVCEAVASSGGGSSARTLDRPFAGIVVSRETDPERLPDSILAGQMTVGTKPTQLTPQNGFLTVSRSLAATRARRVRDLVKQAKTQLPDAAPSGIFIQIGGAGSAAAQLEQMIGHPAHQTIVWAATWTGLVPQHAIWREGQPFDKRLLNEQPSTRINGAS